MVQKNILALSSSRVGQTSFLETAAPLIQNFLDKGVLNIAFIAFASVENDYEAYTSMVSNALKDLKLNIRAVLPGKAKAVVEECDAIMTGGGNTFKLLHDLYDLDLLETIRQKVNRGTPYIGWSAGANITGLTIGTTNDMPIIQPAEFKALGFFPFQINPHYFNQKMEGHNGETRDQRLTEFTKLNPGVTVVCLPEGTALRLQNDILTFTGICPGVLFEAQKEPGAVSRKEVPANTDLSYLL